MKKYTNECVGCDGEDVGLRCLGDSCPYKNVVRFYCDKCGREDKLRYYDDRELCEF